MSRVGVAAVLVVSFSALAGWYGGVAWLTSLNPGHASMKPNGALALIALAVAVVLLERGRWAVPFGTVAAVLGAATLVEYLVGISLSIDSLLPGIDLGAEGARLAPTTAFGLVLLGLAVVAGSLRRGTAMRSLALVSFGISQVALLGYVYGVAALYTVGSATAMAVNTAACVAVISLLLLVHEPSAGLVGLIRDTGSAGTLLRPLAPLLVLGPAVLGWVRLWAQDQGWFGTRAGVVGLVMSMTLLGGAVSWRAAVRLRELDRERDEALRVRDETNKSLDGTVRERTRELAERQSFTDAMLETVDVGIVWCDSSGAGHMRNRVTRAMAGLDEESRTLRTDEVTHRMEVLDATGHSLPLEQYPLVRALRGEAVGGADMLVGARGGPYREVVIKGNQIHGEDDQLLGAVIVLTDVTTERTASRALDQERARLNDAQRLGHLGSFECDLETGDWTYSDQMYEVWGVDPGGLSSEVIAALIVEEDRETAASSWAEALRLGGRHLQEFRIHRASDGAERALRANLEVDLAPGSRPVRVRGTHLDVTELTAAEKAAQRANAFFDAVLAATPDFTFVTDLATGAVIYASKDKDILGIDGDQLRALGAEAAATLIHPDDQPRLKAINAAAADLQDGQVLQLRYRAHHTDGDWRWLSRRVTPFRRNPVGTVVEVLGVVRDISEVMEAEHRLTHAALHDGLTGLPNRALLMDRLEAALARSARDGREVAVLFCDLDGFKRVNDIAGHAAGDALLLEIARRLQQLVREHDTVARVGGDEFVIIVEPWNRVDHGEAAQSPEATFEADRVLAVTVADRISVALQQPVSVNGVDHVVSSSIGITYATLGSGRPTRPVTAEQVLQDADTAMYLAKGRGKDRFEVFEHGLHTDLAERNRVEQLLRQALGLTAIEAPGGASAGATPTFSAAYQPVFDSATGALTGFEALARLTDGDGLNIQPDVFIPIAEQSGIIHPLGRAMLKLACRQLRCWRGEIPGLENITMAVNISALQAQHDSLPGDVRTALNSNDLDPHDLVLELTETALLQVANSTLTALRGLRTEGVGIAIDDFGTGYASLRYLATLPVTAVKIDRSFTAGLPRDPTSHKIVKAVAALAADMGLDCIVEGVETPEQQAALPKGVLLQGYLLGRPQRPDDMDILALTMQVAH